VQAVALDLGHTIIDFGPAEDALRDTYARVLDILTATALTQAPDAATMVRRVSHYIWDQVTASYEREELEELDILALFDRALRGLGLQPDPQTVRTIAVMEHRALASGDVLASENPEDVPALKEQASGNAIIELTGVAVRLNQTDGGTAEKN